MLSYLYAVVAACTVNEELAVDIDGDVVYLLPALALACAAAPGIRTVAFPARSVFTGKEYEIARLKLGSVGKEHTHLVALLRHTCGSKSIHGG